MVCEEIIDCINKTAPSVDFETPFKMIRTTNIKGGRVNLDEVKYVDESTFIKWTRRSKLKKNDIILTREAPLGEVGLLRVNDTFFLGQRTMVYRANGIDLSQLFLYYSFLSFPLQSQIKSLGSGSTVEHLRVPHAENLEIPYPSLPIQRKIAAILSAYDDLIENNNRRIAILEKMAEEIYREWFVRMRFPEHEKAKFIKGLPEDWKLKKIGDLCKKVTDGSHFSPSEASEGYYMASVKDMAEHTFNYDSMKIISEQDYISLVKSDCKPKKNDILIAKDGSYLKHVFLCLEDLALVILSSIAILRPNINEVNPLYLTYYLKQPFIRDTMSNYVTGSALPRIILNDFKKIKLMVAPLELQNEFSRIAKNHVFEINVLINKIIKLKLSRDRLLTRLMSGKLDVENLDIHFPKSMEEGLA